MKMQVSYYYRTTHRDHGYEKYVEPGREAFRRRFGKRTVEETVAEEVYSNGKKHYRYTSKAEFDSRERESRTEEETAGGGVLTGEYRPRRTDIKL